MLMFAFGINVVFDELAVTTKAVKTVASASPTVKFTGPFEIPPQFEVILDGVVMVGGIRGLAVNTTTFPTHPSLLVWVILAVPTATAETSPVVFTVAIAVLLDVHVAPEFPVLADN
jgi:hypothetical protein